MRRACVIVAKAPEPGKAKTRLVPRLSPEDAAALYAGFLLDAVQLALGLHWERVSLIHPHGCGAALATLVPPDVELVEQPGQGLQAALSYAFEHHIQSERFDRVVLIGSDNPTLHLEPIETACRALDRADVSIGPTSDGGYYLLGMRQFHRALFEDIEWSTPRVHAQTVGQAERLGLRVETVQRWFDVDGPADLDRLQRELGASPPSVAPHTRRALEHISSMALSTAPGS
jgi:rSAM/selenodomain-associated transferase 1